MNRRQYNHSSLGSASLGLAFALTAGMLFVMTFYNLVQYVGAKAAVERAARKVSRCLTPTDPLCRTTTFAGPSTQVANEWYGYTPGSNPGVMEVFAPMMKYEASMTRVRYGAQYQTHEIHTVEPRAQFDTLSVNMRTFRGELNPWLDIYYRIPIPFGFEENVLRSRYQPPYPNLPAPGRDINEEALIHHTHVHLDTASRIADMNLRSGNNHTWRVVSLPQKRLERAVSDNQCQHWVSGWITVPSTADGDRCEGCNAWDLANDSGPMNPEDWAYLMLLPSAKVDVLFPVGASREWTKIGYGCDSPRVNGIRVEVRNPDTSSYAFYNLGSRITTHVGEAHRSNGNRFPRRPYFNKKPRYQTNDSRIPLRLPRGGSFRVYYALRARRGDGSYHPVNITPEFAWTVDEYDLHQVFSELGQTTCKDIRWSTAENRFLCESVNHSDSSICSTPIPDGLDLNFSVCNATEGLKRAQPDYAVPRCDWDPHSFVVTANDRHEDFVVTDAIPVCDPGWIPPEMDLMYGAMPARTCSWKLEGEAAPEQVLASAGSGNACSSTVTSKIDCGKRFASGMVGEPWDCPGVQEVMDKTQAITNEVNRKRIKHGLPPFDGKNMTTTWLSQPVSDDWEFSWTSAFDNHDLSGTSALRTYRHTLEKENEPVLFKKKIETTPALALLDAIKNEVNAPTGAPGWNEFKASFDKHVIVSEKSVDSVPIKNVYPFINPVPELYVGQKGLEKGIDFDHDCTIDERCPVAPMFASVEEALRQHASNAVKEAADTSYEFHYSEEFLGMEHLGSFSSAREVAALGLPECAPTKTSCHSGPGFDSKLVSLGQGSSPPSGCLNGSYEHCFSERVRKKIDDGQGDEAIDVALAERVGFDEISRILPYAEQCSGGAKCVEVHVDTSTGLTADVEVVFHMPVGFPLDAILGRQSVPVRHRKTELLESALLANN